MIDFGYHLIVDHLRVLKQLFHRVDRADHDSLAGQRINPFPLGLPLKYVVQQRVKFNHLFSAEFLFSSAFPRLPYGLKNEEEPLSRSRYNSHTRKKPHSAIPTYPPVGRRNTAIAPAAK
jgi:hypothetical protein